MKLKRNTPPWRIVIGGVLFGVFFLVQLRRIFGDSMSSPQIVAAILAVITLILLIVRRSDMPLFAVDDEHILIRGEKYPLSKIEYVDVRESMGLAQEIIIKMEGYQPHEIALIEGDRDRDANRICDFLSEALPKLQINRVESTE